MPKFVISAWAIGDPTDRFNPHVIASKRLMLDRALAAGHIVLPEVVEQLEHEEKTVAGVLALEAELGSCLPRGK